MNRQEAITAITDLISWLEGSPEEHGSTTYVYANDMREAVEALKPPTPDPDTGLMKCGCGGKAKIWPSDPTQFTRAITDYEVGCTECAMTTGWVRGKQENAVKVWNTAMGWKGGAE